jgi:hypothetical protein
MCVHELIAMQLRERVKVLEADFQSCAHELEISDAAADRAVARASQLEAALVCPCGGDYGTHRCIRCDSEVGP